MDYIELVCDSDVEMCFFDSGEKIKQCCSCFKHRAIHSASFQHYGYNYISTHKSRFWLCSIKGSWYTIGKQDVQFQKLANKLLQLSQLLFSSQFLCLFLLLFQWPVTTLATYQREWQEAYQNFSHSGILDMHNCSYCLKPSKLFTEQFCEKFNISNKFPNETATSKQSVQSARKWTLFCDDIPTVALLNVDSGTCQHLSNILWRDSCAQCNYFDFQTIMHHYATYQNYTSQSNTSVCLSSYKAWICSYHHKLYKFNPNSSCWQIWDPCPSFCRRTESVCPFFRIGDKDKSLGSAPVFLCEGYGDHKNEQCKSSDYGSCNRGKSCFDDFSDFLVKIFQDSNATTQSTCNESYVTESVITNSSKIKSRFTYTSSFLAFFTTLLCLNTY